MKRPALSICIPASEGGLSLLSNTLDSLDAQTSDNFEVVVGWDSPHVAFPSHELPEICVPLEWAWSPRTAGQEHLPHRNHARNTAARIALGEYLWFIDADFLLDPWAVTYMIMHLEKGVALTPTLCGIGEHGQPLDNQWSGLASSYRSKRLSYVDAGPIPEGFPALHRDVFRALGGFDERFIGWGGNKEEFVSRLNRVGDLVPYRLLHGVRGYHQRHPPNKGDAPLVERNQIVHQQIKRDMDGGADWWLERVANVREVLQHG